MEKITIIALLEKYWQAGTTIAEEKMLADYFRTADDLDPELAPYRDLFLYFEQETQVRPEPGFEERILERVGLRTQRRPIFRIGFIAAAASICAIVAGLMLLTPHADERPPAIASTTYPGQAIASTVRPRQTIPSTAIQDTYEDPEQALAAVRHALLVASTHLNEGRRSLTGAKK
jgi:hypothetical protein